MTIILSGIYKQGKIEILQPPDSLREGPVRVVVIEEGKAEPTPRYLTYGKYRSGRMSSLEDFAEADWRCCDSD